MKQWETVISIIVLYYPACLDKFIIQLLQC